MKDGAGIGNMNETISLMPNTDIGLLVLSSP